MTRLLALDLWSTVGHARLQAGTRPRFGSFKVTGPDLTWKHGQLWVWLEEQYQVDPFDGLAWEEPIMTKTDTVDDLLLVMGQAGICCAFVGKHKLRWQSVSLYDAKVAITGSRGADKKAMLHAAQRTLNWEVKNHHEADAGAVGVVAYARLWPKTPRLAV